MWDYFSHGHSEGSFGAEIVGDAWGSNLYSASHT